jgi:hypothetical protein
MNIELEFFKIHVSPSQSGHFVDSPAGGCNQQNHDSFSRFQYAKQAANLGHGQNRRNFLALLTLADNPVYGPGR